MASALSPRSSGRLVRTIVYKSFSKNHDLITKIHKTCACERLLDQWTSLNVTKVEHRRGSALMLKVSTDAVTVARLQLPVTHCTLVVVAR